MAKKFNRRKGVLLAALYLAFWGLNIAAGNAFGTMARYDQGAAALFQVGFAVLGFPFAAGALYYLLARLITRLIGRPGGRYFFAGLVFLIGVGALVAGTAETVQGLRSSSFSTVQGTILSSAMRTESSTSSSDDGRNRNRTTYTYYFDVAFEYEVGGTTFRGKEYDTSGGSLPLKVASALPDRYPAGAAVTVWYDPASVQTAYLKPGLAGTWYLLLLMGMILTALGTTALVWLERRHRGQEPRA